MNWKPWGLSPAYDRVRSMVSGIAPSRARGRLLLVLQVFVDDSLGDAGNLVLAGYLAPASSWSEFAADWEALLPLAPLNRANSRQFKMSTMNVSQDRLQWVPAFYRVIEEHVSFAFSFSVNVKDFASVKKKLSAGHLSVDWALMDRPFCFLFFALVKNLSETIDKLPHIFPEGDKVDFYFDMQSEMDTVLSAWGHFLASAPPHIRGKFGGAPKFENDEDFLPLQAADFWAWWNRKWLDDGNLDGFHTMDFNRFGPTRNVPRMDTFFNKNDIELILKSIIQSNRIDG